MATLDDLFHPRSVAVLGASRNRESIGFALVRNLLDADFAGTIFPVNPHAEVISCLKCYPSVTAVPDPVDLAVVAVPKAAVPATIDECLAKGVKGLVVITAGFGETGAEGAERERALRGKVRAAGVRLVGPNCMGIINTHPAVRLNATFAPVAARPGHLGFVSQSGALGVAILNLAADLGVGLTQFVSMGNKADVSGNDLLELWENDPETRIIAMYLESFGNPRRFAEIARRVAAKKPILVVKSGRTAEGARAASSHTGALAGPDVTISALLDQCGVLRADTIDELFDLARALDRCPLPAGESVAVVTNAGGPGIMATDSCVGLGLKMAELAPETKMKLAAFLPPEASLANPVDMIASADEDSYARSLAAVLEDPGVDMVMAINVTPLLTNPMAILEAITSAARDATKPVLAVIMAGEDFYEEIQARDEPPPVYRFPEPAARALAKMARYAAWRARPQDHTCLEPPVDHAGLAALFARHGPGYLPAAAAFRALEMAGIPTLTWRAAPDADGAAAAAAEIGLPVALKADAPGLVHKSELGAVALALESVEEVRQAARRMAERLAAAGLPEPTFLVQEMVAGGHEVIFGLTSDARFGPVLLFGLGGKYVEVFRDVRFGVPPLSGIDAEEMIRGIRGVSLLTGVRGEAGADLPRLREVLLRLSEIAAQHPQLAELDVNPFLAAPPGGSAVALDVRIRLA
ncbi:MAG TPA: acetate--CoA ligase family protein [Thermoanaerobaculia bacterium]|nr:acetate--CoA ligase family protein [Thermoanaerobaculia bacterium]